MADIYLDRELYSKLINRLVALQPCPFAGEITSYQLKLVLGETAGIWPEQKWDISHDRRPIKALKN
jgi:hypothetical protein